MRSIEANFDGLVGPTHNYAGLSYGNVASKSNEGAVSRPRDAALQGLGKMRYLRDLGLFQGMLPPPARPDVDALRKLGFTGSDHEIVHRAGRESPLLLAAATSASSMWAANAATVGPSADAADGRVHFTPANLISTLHRTLEPMATARALRRVFGDPRLFVHHDPLPSAAALGDEGAANHTRFEPADGGAGVHFFVYGRVGLGGGVAPARFPARQTLEASQAIARLHGLAPERTIFAQQTPAVIDEGVFHNDVIAVGHRHVLLCHERAFVDQRDVIASLRRALGESFVVVEVRSDELSVGEAVRSYLFNSQLVTLPGGEIALIAPVECRESDATRAVIDRIVADPAIPVAAVHYLDVRQSMRNGGGPACLRLRVQLTDTELAAVHAPCVLDDARFATLADWITRHYREELAPPDLADPALLDETRAALDELTRILELGGDFYPFQRA